MVPALTIPRSSTSAAPIEEPAKTPPERNHFLVQAEASAVETLLAYWPGPNPVDAKPKADSRTRIMAMHFSSSHWPAIA